jgi:hypothetical protein
MHWIKLCCVASIVFASSPDCRAQSSTIVDQLDRPVTVTRYVDETVVESQKRTSWKPLWQTEKRERRTTVLKPVQKTYDRVEKFTVLTPVTETKYREREIEETTYEEVTEMREERRVVQKPVVETEMREQAVPVRTKVTETEIRTQNVTVMKPTTVTQTALTPGPAVAVPTGANNFRPQLQWLRRGTYADPGTGLTTWRRPGLHWVQPPAAVAVPTVVPTTVQSTALVPEVVQRSEPVEVTRYVDKVELRKVPVEVTKMIEQVEVRKVPVTVRRPKITKRVERIPYQETTYKEQVVTKTTPVTETTYERVEQVEPYEEQACRWVQHTEEIKVPKVVRKRIDETIYRTPSSATDTPSKATSETKHSVLENDSDAQETSSTATPTYNFSPVPVAAQLVETSQRQRQSVTGVKDSGNSRQSIDYSQSPVIRPSKSMYEPTDSHTIEVPETKPDLNNPRTKLAKIERPEWLDQANRQQSETEKAVVETSSSIDWEAPEATKPTGRKGYFKLQDGSQ